ncbi:hypothetical protein [Arenicella chitinivorans]|uniref:hypothetical protein n=1 Tax=Arenicella chitinivorans TaxID=1329800 RepID=UPI001678800A|nr:hypothetical protein [Arenicella chitinivorans]
MPIRTNYRFQTSIALFVMLCYLVATSVSTAHAFPMLANVSSTFTEPAHLDTTPSMAEMDCHQAGPTTSALSSCDVFCSVMTQAITGSVFALAPDTQPTQTRAEVHSQLRSFLTVLEPHPPKW